MNPTVTPAVTHRCVDVPGAVMYYERRGSGPTVLLVGNPMDATWFAPLADLLAVRHTVLTTDPRGINRSPIDVESDVAAETRADDLVAILLDAGVGPAAVFGSSGGAVSVLALAQRRPDLVHTVIAHEPPLEELLDDRDARRAVAEDIVATYLSGDPIGAWTTFLAAANIEDANGPETAGPEGPGQDAAAHQGPMLPSDPDPQAAADERFFFAHLLRPTTSWVPDIERLRQVPTRIVVAIGAESAGQTCDLTSRALAARLASEVAIYPGDHLGFAVDPVAFAARLTDDLSG